MAASFLILSRVAAVEPPSDSSQMRSFWSDVVDLSRVGRFGRSRKGDFNFPGTMIFARFHRAIAFISRVQAFHVLLLSFGGFTAVWIIDYSPFTINRSLLPGVDDAVI